MITETESQAAQQVIDTAAEARNKYDSINSTESERKRGVRKTLAMYERNEALKDALRDHIIQPLMVEIGSIYIESNEETGYKPFYGLLLSDYKALKVCFNENGFQLIKMGGSDKIEGVTPFDEQEIEDAIKVGGMLENATGEEIMNRIETELAGLKTRIVEHFELKT